MRQKVRHIVELVAIWGGVGSVVIIFWATVWWLVFDKLNVASMWQVHPRYSGSEHQQSNWLVNRLGSIDNQSLASWTFLAGLAALTFSMLDLPDTETASDQPTTELKLRLFTSVLVMCLSGLILLMPA